MYLFGREPLVEVVVSYADGLGLLAHVAVGLAWIGVLLLDDGGNAKEIGRHQCRSAGETANADNHIWLETFQDGDGTVEAVREFKRQQERLDFFGEAADP